MNLCKFVSIIIIPILLFNLSACYKTGIRYRSVPYTDYEIVEKKVNVPQEVRKIKDPECAITNVPKTIAISDVKTSIKGTRNLAKSILFEIESLLDSNTYWQIVDINSAKNILSGRLTKVEGDRVTLEMYMKYPGSVYAPWSRTFRGYKDTIALRIGRVILPTERVTIEQVEKIIEERVPVTKTRRESYTVSESSGVVDFFLGLLLIGLGVFVIVVAVSG